MGPSGCSRALCVVVAVAVSAGVWTDAASAQVRRREPQPRAVPPGKKPAGPPVFDTNLNVKEAIDAAVSRAKVANKRVLIVWGDNDSPWPPRLRSALLFPDTSRMLAYEYEVVWADVGSPGTGEINAAIAQTYGADPKGLGTPLLTVLDGDGKALMSVTAKRLVDPSPSGGVPSYRITSVEEFLAGNRAPHPLARPVYDAALAKAKDEKKVVFLRFVEPLDQFCLKLDRVLAAPEVAPVLDKRFVLARIDIDRSQGGHELLEQASAGKAETVPWFAVFDADGKVVADGRSETTGDIGWPSSAAEIEVFLAMLKKAAPEMPEGDLAAVRAAFEAAQEVPREAAAKAPETPAKD